MNTYNVKNCRGKCDNCKKVDYISGKLICTSIKENEKADWEQLKKEDEELWRMKYNMFPTAENWNKFCDRLQHFLVKKQEFERKFPKYKYYANSLHGNCYVAKIKNLPEKK